MKGLNHYIKEAFKITGDTKINKLSDVSDNYNDDDFPCRVRKRSGQEFQWFTWWKYLMDNGPTSKRDLLSHFNLVTTSYPTLFAKLSKQNVIVPSHGNLEAKKPDEWKL